MYVYIYTIYYIVDCQQLGLAEGTPNDGAFRDWGFHPGPFRWPKSPKGPNFGPSSETWRLVVYGSPAKLVEFLGSKTTIWLFNIAMENGSSIDDFPIKTSIYKGFSMAMLNNQMVTPISQKCYTSKCLIREGEIERKKEPSTAVAPLNSFPRDLATEPRKIKCERFHSQINFPIYVSICAMAAVLMQLVSSTAIDYVEVSPPSPERTESGPFKYPNPQMGLPFLSYRKGPQRIRTLVSN